MLGQPHPAAAADGCQPARRRGAEEAAQRQYRTVEVGQSGEQAQQGLAEAEWPSMQPQPAGMLVLLACTYRAGSGSPLPLHTYLA